jgi:hypothetical protein
MTELKEGDRVEVKFEGVATHPLDGYGNVCVSAMGRTQWYPVQCVTKLHDPLPTNHKVAVLIVDGGYMHLLQRLGDFWYEPSVNGPVEHAYVQRLADKNGFTVLYAGDDE